MKALWNELMENESGLILSAEMILVLTIAVLGMVTGLVCVQQAVVGELQDLALAFGGLNQSYSTPTYSGCLKWRGRTSWSAGSGFLDFYDGCVGGGSMATGYGTDQTGVVYGGSETISGAGCGTTSLSHGPLPTVSTPHPIPAPAPSPCDGCQPGSTVVTPLRP